MRSEDHEIIRSKVRRLMILPLLILSLTITGCGESYSHMTQEEAQKFINSNPDAIILDVRTPEEYERKHIPNAILIPIDDLRQGDFSKLPDKNQTILIYCWTGRRAEDAAIILVEHGYTKVYEFGGLVDWTGSVTGTDIE